MTQNHAEPVTLKTLSAALLISAALVVPFIIMQLVNRRNFQEDFPFVLFTFMALHALLIVLLLKPALRRLRTEKTLKALGLGHWAGLLLGLFLLIVYAAVVIDQWPCFIGMPNCD